MWEKNQWDCLSVTLFKMDLQLCTIDPIQTWNAHRPWFKWWCNPSMLLITEESASVWIFTFELLSNYWHKCTHVRGMVVLIVNNDLFYFPDLENKVNVIINSLSPSVLNICHRSWSALTQLITWRLTGARTLAVAMRTSVGRKNWGMKGVTWSQTLLKICWFWRHMVAKSLAIRGNSLLLN